MKKCFLFIFLYVSCFSLHAIDYSGIYSYNKGLNKPNGSLCVFQVKSDSVFFYLSNMTGVPDFNLTNLKGFLRIDSNFSNYIKDACIINFKYDQSIISVTQNNSCKSDFLVEGKYKKDGNSLKRPNTWMTEFTEKSGVIQLDSALVFFAPHSESRKLLTLKKETVVKILDEVNGFFLIEIPKQKNEFLWTLKKNVMMNK